MLAFDQQQVTASSTSLPRGMTLSLPSRRRRRHESRKRRQDGSSRASPRRGHCTSAIGRRTCARRCCIARGVLVGESAGIVEVRESIEILYILNFALHEDAVPGPKRHVGQIRQAIAVAAKHANDADVEPRSKPGMSDQFADEWRAFGQRDLGVGDFGCDHRFQYRRFALDDEVTPALQFLELVDASLNENAVATRAGRFAGSAKSRCARSG